MIKATDARDLKVKAEREQIESKRKTAKEYCESLSERIVERANDRYSAIEVNDYPIEVRSYVVEELQNNGYNVQVLKDRLFIAWF